MVEIVQYAWRETVRRKSRSLWSIIGYLIATGFLVIAVSAIHSSRGAASSALGHTGTQFIGYITRTDPDNPPAGLVDPVHEGFYAYNNPTLLFPVSQVEKIKKSANVGEASALLSFRIRPREDSVSTWLLLGFDPSHMEAVRMVGCSATDVVAGRALEPGDSGSVLLEQTFAESQGLDAGDKLALGGREFKVAGVMSPGTRPAKGDIYMPLAEAAAVVNTRLARPLGNQVNVVLVDGATVFTNADAMTDVKNVLGANSAVGGYGCFSPAGKAVGLTQQGFGLLTFIVGVGVVALAIRSQYSSVIERRRDIGILKAIGWTDRGVVFQIFAESVIQAFLGGASGCILAALLFAAFPVGQWLGLRSAELTLSSSVMGLGLALTVLAGAFAGVIPALATARMRPADILRKP